ncbi:ribosomal protein S18-alanine N-acetyltransferase [Pseudonocardia spinosispora]|uniref:ribosomal protein S18-alanine N-acetyltransferase n=1 Tax=Pseudonocardia spinosispora TaxID=103441 RepID=UPI00041100EA|nr:ribosomal protein S18-alanine N-acetyltransferase [Pseudonocardia spinosispora]
MSDRAPAITIGPLYSADAPDCAALEKVLFPGDDPWSAQMFRDELAIGHFYVAARSSGGLIGYGGLAVVGSASGSHPAEAEIHTIGVAPDQQGHGVGRLLLAQLLARADELGAAVFLEVRTDNSAALGLYRSTGFEQLGIRRNYYRPSGADAFTMCRPARRSSAG